MLLILNLHWYFNLKFSSVWTSSAETFTLKTDNINLLITFYCDSNVVCFFKHLSKSDVAAIFVLCFNFFCQIIDIFVCSSTFDNFFCYISFIKKSFQFDIDFIDNIVFFICKENSSTELILEIWDYNWTFSEVYTIWNTEVKNSVSHQCLIKYDFESVKLMIQLKSDKYLKEKESASIKYSLSDRKNDNISALLKITLFMIFNAVFLLVTNIIFFEIHDCAIFQFCVFDLKTCSFTTSQSLNMNKVKQCFWVN